ncbi:hypothetical protein [Kribbella speibonae]|uniref:Uncharacterized protein n=1 Tax=Kribbella speibonae TaxID=1572660 RepID=A0ABY2A2Y9_9ACTN|nr:hypothetical protein [Kribbella speibonae]TCC22763.1 hypothetical protein E0H58_20480 [Kribbella speibonae]
MSLLDRLQYTVFENPRLLPSATEGVEFTAMFEVVWRPRRRRESNLQDALRADVIEAASATSITRSAYDVRAAENFINTRLAAWGRTATGRYRHISPKVSLSLSDDAAETLAQRRADEERVRRLTFLKTKLYSDPALVVVERLERNPERSSENLIAEYIRAAQLIESSQRWWAPLLEGTAALDQRYRTQDLAFALMSALTATVNELANQRPPD